MKEYIEYIKSLKINELKQKIAKFELNQISFEDLQFSVIESGGFSLKVFEKDKKIEDMLGK